MTTMGDTLEPQLTASKGKLEKRAMVPAKAKKGSVLSAIEDIQRMSPEAICQEFDRLVEHTQRHFREQALMPCTDVASRLRNCLHAHPLESFKCFNIMADYRQCVALATQNYIDQLAEKDAGGKVEAFQRRQEQQQQPPLHPLPMVPPQSVPPPTMSNEAPRRTRRWYKPWSWLP